MELFGSLQLRPDGWQLAVESDDGDNKFDPVGVLELHRGVSGNEIF